MYYPRILDLQAQLAKKSVLLLGPRRTGKSSLIQKQVKADHVYNLLHSDTFLRLSTRPSLIRESVKKKNSVVVIDEIQKLPILMDEVHAMIEESGTRFMLTGSSLRKLKRNYTSLMAGRAKTLHLCPFTSKELGKDFDLARALLYGTLPPVYLSEDPQGELQSYVGDYLREEIHAEALARNIHSFSRFLTTAAHTNGQLINFESLASDAQVPPRTVRDYFALLEDTLLGETLYSTQNKGGRKAISHGKFYFFDTGVLNALLGRKELVNPSKEFGDLFEHLVYLELKAYVKYFRPDSKIHFWRSRTGTEVDFVIEDLVAIEVKASRMVTDRDLKGLVAFHEEKPRLRKIVVSQDSQERKVGPVEIFPVQKFLEKLWNHELLSSA